MLAQAFKSFCAGFIRQEEPAYRDEALYEALYETQEAIRRDRENAARTADRDLTDMYIYQIKANELRYSHLLHLIRENEEETHSA